MKNQIRDADAEWGEGITLDVCVRDEPGGQSCGLFTKGTGQRDGLNQFSGKPPGTVLITLFLLFLVPAL